MSVLENKIGAENVAHDAAGNSFIGKDGKAEVFDYDIARALEAQLEKNHAVWSAAHTAETKEGRYWIDNSPTSLAHVAKGTVQVLEGEMTGDELNAAGPALEAARLQQHQRDEIRGHHQDKIYSELQTAFGKDNVTRDGTKVQTGAFEDEDHAKAVMNKLNNINEDELTSVTAAHLVKDANNKFHVEVDLAQMAKYEDARRSITEKDAGAIASKKWGEEKAHHTAHDNKLHMLNEQLKGTEGKVHENPDHTVTLELTNAREAEQLQYELRKHPLDGNVRVDGNSVIIYDVSMLDTNAIEESGKYMRQQHAEHVQVDLALKEKLGMDDKGNLAQSYDTPDGALKAAKSLATTTTVDNGDTSYSTASDNASAHRGADGKFYVHVDNPHNVSKSDIDSTVGTITDIKHDEQVRRSGLNHKANSLASTISDKEHPVRIEQTSDNRGYRVAEAFDNPGAAQDLKNALNEQFKGLASVVDGTGKDAGKKVVIIDEEALRKSAVGDIGAESIGRAMAALNNEQNTPEIAVASSDTATPKLVETRTAAPAPKSLEDIAKSFGTGPDGNPNAIVTHLSGESDKRIKINGTFSGQALADLQGRLGKSNIITTTAADGKTEVFINDASKLEGRFGGVAGVGDRIVDAAKADQHKQDEPLAARKPAAPATPEVLFTRDDLQDISNKAQDLIFSKKYAEEARTDAENFKNGAAAYEKLGKAPLETAEREATSFDKHSWTISKDTKAIGFGKVEGGEKADHFVTGKIGEQGLTVAGGAKDVVLDAASAYGIDAGPTKITFKPGVEADGQEQGGALGVVVSDNDSIRIVEFDEKNPAGPKKGNLEVHIGQGKDEKVILVAKAEGGRDLTASDFKVTKVNATGAKDNSWKHEGLASADKLRAIRNDAEIKAESAEKGFKSNADDLLAKLDKDGNKTLDSKELQGLAGINKAELVAIGKSLEKAGIKYDVVAMNNLSAPDTPTVKNNAKGADAGRT